MDMKLNSQLKKPSIKVKRIIAFVMDMCIVSLLVTILSSNNLTNPYYEKYMEEYENYVEVYNNEVENLKNNVDTTSVINNMSDSIYNLEKYNIYSGIYYLIIYFVYFGIIQYITGYTIGKKINGIKIVNKDGSDISIHKLMIRCLINGCNTFYGVNICVLINILLLFNKSLFYNFYYINTMIGFIIQIIFIVNLFNKKDNRLLNDYIFQTKVVESE